MPVQRDANGLQAWLVWEMVVFLVIWEDEFANLTRGQRDHSAVDAIVS